MTRLRTAAAVGCALLCAAVAATTAGATGQKTQRAEGGGGPGAKLAQAAAEEVVKGALGEAGGQLFTTALSVMGLGGDAATAAALAEISKQLERANTQLTTLRNETQAIANQLSK